MAGKNTSSSNSMPSMTETPRIRRLDEVVVNRIAAGEIIQRPANALKEMIENCLDAKAKSINVVVKDGGLKLLQIQDDGCGIDKADLGIVCERFTTSKLQNFEDLRSINTYGFRGEALASISHVAHVTITTRTAHSSCAYKAKYLDGKLVPFTPGGAAEPQTCAGNPGTQIVVEDLFYNVATRRKALKSPAEEYSKVAEVIEKYAIHNSGVSFSLKKHGEMSAEIRTQPLATTVDNIRAIYGANVANELEEMTAEDAMYGLKAHGYISNPNYSAKKGNFLLFINHRLVNSSSIKKAIDQTYSQYLPKNSFSFVYLSVELPPESLDVNVHPTKKEVQFLHEEEIVAIIQKALEGKLQGANSSRTFYTQTLLLSSSQPSSSKLVKTPSQLNETDNPNASKDKDSVRSSQKSDRVYEHNLVRTDSKMQTLNAFLTRPPSQSNLGGGLGTSSPLSNQALPPFQQLRGAETGGNDVFFLDGDLEQTSNLLDTTSASSSSDLSLKRKSVTQDVGSHRSSLNLDAAYQSSNTLPLGVPRSSIPNRPALEPSIPPSPPLPPPPPPPQEEEDWDPIRMKPRKKAKPADDSDDVVVLQTGPANSSNPSKPNAPSSSLNNNNNGGGGKGLPTVSTSSHLNVRESETDDFEPAGQVSSSSPAQRGGRLAVCSLSCTCLASVLSLRQEIVDNEYLVMKNLLQNHTFVGVINAKLSLIQHLTKLYIVDTFALRRELFYQLALRGFGQFGKIELSPPAPLYDLLMLALDSPEAGWSPDDGPKDALAQFIVQLLTEHGPMIEEYFSISVKNGNLHTLPLLVDNYRPKMSRLPLFLLRLATEVNWETEKACFQSIAREIGLFYQEHEYKREKPSRSPEKANLADTILDSLDPSALTQVELSQPLPSTPTIDPSSDSSLMPMPWTVEHVIFPVFRSHFHPPKSLGNEASVLQIADLHDLYKVFERC